MTETIEQAEDRSVHDILRSLAGAMKTIYFPATDDEGNPLITRFFLDNGRYPHITDEVKPWHYKGWLLMYVQECYAAMTKVCEVRRAQMSSGKPVPPLPKELHFGAFCDRWSYYFRQIDADGITDEPIPQIEFFSALHPAAAPGLKMLENTISGVEQIASSWHVFSDFVDFLAFALGVSPQKSRFDDKVCEYIYRYFDISKLLITPADYLGHLYAESKVNKHNRTGFYPTPSSVVECMARMVASDFNHAAKFDTVNDCCVGTGRMLMHASNFSLRLSGQDIDGVCVKSCLINGALFVPWMSFPFPERFFAEADAKKEANKRAVLKSAPETLNVSSEALNASHAPRNKAIQPNLIDIGTSEKPFRKQKPTAAPKKIILNEDVQGKLF